MNRPPTLAAWLSKEPFTLVLSSGFFGFFAHAGVAATLLERGLRPTALAGSSAGALVSGLVASGVGPGDIVKELDRLDRRDFWDPGLGFGLLRGEAFERLLRRLVGHRRIEDCEIPVKVSVFDVLRRETRVVREGDLATALRASCAFPGLFHPVRVDGRRCLDGGILDRPALAAVSPGTRVLHHHLASKSPWRTAIPKSIEAPRRANQITLVMRHLPRSGPHALDKGRAAMRLAAATLHELLDREVSEGIVEVG